MRTLPAGKLSLEEAGHIPVLHRQLGATLGMALGPRTPTGLASPPQPTLFLFFL